MAFVIGYERDMENQEIAQKVEMYAENVQLNRQDGMEKLEFFAADRKGQFY